MNAERRTTYKGQYVSSVAARYGASMTQTAEPSIVYDVATKRIRISSWGCRALSGALTWGLLALLTACSASSSETPTPSASPIVESIASCFGWTAQLTLEREAGDGTPVAVPSLVIGGTLWRLTVEGPALLALDEAATASLDTFTIRGDRAVRRDLALVRWLGAAQSLTAQGAVLLPAVEGAIREGDQGRILAWIQTPGGNFGVSGFIFELRPEGAGVAIRNPAPLPQEPCPTP